MTVLFEKLLLRLKLLHRINIVFYLSLLAIAVLIAIFLSTSRMMEATLTDNIREYRKITGLSQQVVLDLKRLDGEVFEAAMTEKGLDLKQLDVIYARLLEKLRKIRYHDYFADDAQAQKAIGRFISRLKSYRKLLVLLPKQQGDDLLWIVTDLNRAGTTMIESLTRLNDSIAEKSKERVETLKRKIQKRRMAVFVTIALLFGFLFYLNRQIVLSILHEVWRLKAISESFLDVLAKKRDRVRQESFEGRDEIAQIGRMILEHVHVAESLLKIERDQAREIERKVEEATREIRSLNAELESTQREIVFTIGAIAEKRSHETGKHVERVAEYSYLLAMFAGMTHKEALLLKNASPLHDIGKLAIPDAILNKPGKLSDEEFEVMKTHTTHGYEMLCHSRRSILKAGAAIAHQHHEKWDGSGYPRGLRGEEIDLYARITTIADVFDALVTPRVYKKAWSIEKILDYFEEQKGKAFDPRLVEIFVDNLEHFLAAKYRIDKENRFLSQFIENFDKLPDNLQIRT